MEDKQKDSQEPERSTIFQVTPRETPSENYLVIENLQRMPSIFSRGLLYLIVLAFLSALIYTLLSKIDMVKECNAVARPVTHKVKILSDRSGYIERIFISEGQEIEKNAPLFQIRSKEALTYIAKVDELRHSIPLKTEHYNTKISSISDELNQLYSNYTNSLKINKLKLEQNNLSLNSIRSDISYWQNEIASLSKEYKSAKTLLEKGIISVSDYNNSKSRLERARTEEKILASKKDITFNENKIIEREIEKEKGDYKNRKVLLEKKMKNLELEKEATLSAMHNELKMTQKIASLQDGAHVTENEDMGTEKIIRAENSGIISELYFMNIGEYVQISNLLCTILPLESPLYMDITVENKDIGFIEENMEIKYKFDAFSYVDHGILVGAVSTISPSAIENKALGLVYHIKGTLEISYFEIKGKKYFIKPGMTATAELITEKKSIFSILYKKVRE